MIERLINMSTAKKRPPVTPRPKQKEQVNKKALIWIGAAIGAIIVVMATLLALDI
jgi:hypothetical protein